jgi:dUTP pyrophosphatase
MTQSTQPMQRYFDKVSFNQYAKSIYGNNYKKEVSEEELSLLQQEYNNIQLPQRGTQFSAGYDVFSPFTFSLEPNEDIKIPTGIKAYMHLNEVLLAFPRSGLGFNYYLRLANTLGVVDADYSFAENEGHIFIKIRNEGNQTLTVDKGKAFCQFIFMKYLVTDDDCPKNQKRVGGMGSTDGQKENN